MTLGERATGTGLEILFESGCQRFIGKFDAHVEFPWTIFSSMQHLTVVVFCQATDNIRRETDVVSLRIFGALEDVNKSSCKFTHDPTGLQVLVQQTSRISWGNLAHALSAYADPSNLDRMDSVKSPPSHAETGRASA